jgi:hypothetical protein
MIKANSRGQAAVRIAVGLLLAISLRPLSAQSNPDRDPAATTLENGQLEASLYTIRPLVDDQRPIRLNRESLLKWNNSVNQIVHGNLFVWMKEGRPEVIASIYQFFSPKTEFAAEFHSLSLTPLVVEKGGREVWAPKQPGVVLKPFDDESQPPATRPERLIKMRLLAEQFSVQLTDWSRETYRLRLLPRPLFRYEPSDPQLLDGALFAFTYTTDPELLVLVEARQTGDGFRWMYGHARMNIGELKVSYRGREVWQAARLEHPYFYENGGYTLFKDLPLPKPGSGN